MKSRFLFCVSLLVVVLLVGFSMEGQAWPWGKKSKAVEYQDPSGWVMKSSNWGPDAITWYNKGIFKQMEKGGTIKTIEIFEYMNKEGEEDFLTFRLIIPENLITWWGPNSRITISYISGKDTLQATSIEYCFHSLCSSRAIISSSSGFSGLNVPPSNCILFSVPHTKNRMDTRLNPIIFVRFPHFSGKPDELIACSASGVLTTSEEVSIR